MSHFNKKQKLNHYDYDYETNNLLLTNNEEFTSSYISNNIFEKQKNINESESSDNNKSSDDNESSDNNKLLVS